MIEFQTCGQRFRADELGLINRAITEAQPRLCAEIARRVCAALNWHDVLGQPKLMSCRVALLRLLRAGLIELPAQPVPQGTSSGVHFNTNPR